MKKKEYLLERLMVATIAGLATSYFFSFVLEKPNDTAAGLGIIVFLIIYVVSSFRYDWKQAIKDNVIRSIQKRAKKDKTLKQ